MTDRPYANPEAAAQRILEVGNSIEPAMKGRIYIELMNGPFLFRDGGSQAKYGADLRQLIERNQLTMHESGTFVWLPDGDLRLTTPPMFQSDVSGKSGNRANLCVCNCNAPLETENST